MSREGSITTTAAAKNDIYTVTLVGSSGQSPDDDPIRWTGQARFAIVGGAFLTATVPSPRSTCADVTSRHRDRREFNAGHKKLNHCADVL